MNDDTRDKLFELLRHWEQARKERLYDHQRALWENLRCAADVADLLRESGVQVPPNLFKNRRFKR